MTNEEHYAQRLAHLGKIAPEDLLCELLALIHGDGGHYADKHGLPKAVADAEVKWFAHLQQRPLTGGESLSDERILHLWDTHVAYETGYKGAQLCNKDKVAFARAVLAAAPSLPVREEPTPKQPPEFQEVSWGLNSVMRPCKGMAVSEYAFREWCAANGVLLATSPSPNKEGATPKDGVDSSDGGKAG